MTRNPSKLGAEIEESISSQFASPRAPVVYMAYFKTHTGTASAVERGTSTHVNLWLPPQETVRRAAESEGVVFKLLPPWPRGRGGDYGRISSLMQEPDLRGAPLYRVRVRTVGQAKRVVEAMA